MVTEKDNSTFPTYDRLMWPTLRALKELGGSGTIHDKGILVTTGTFTADALKEATKDGAPLIDLIDGNRLCDLLKQYRLGVATEQVEQVAVDPQWFQSI